MQSAGLTSNTLIRRARSASPLVFALLCALLANFVGALLEQEEEKEESQSSVIAARDLGEKTKNILTRSIEALNADDDSARRTLDNLNEGRDLLDIAKTQPGACDVMRASMKAWSPGSPDHQKVLSAISAKSKKLDADDLEPTWKKSGKAFKVTCPTKYDKQAVKERFEQDLQVAKKTRAVQQLHISVAAVMGDVLSACLPSYDLDGDFPTLDKFSETKNFVNSEFEAWSENIGDVGEHWVRFKKHLDTCAVETPFNKRRWEGTFTGLGDMIMSDPEATFHSRWKFMDALRVLQDFIVCKLEYQGDGMKLALKAQYLRSTWKNKMDGEPWKTMERLMNPCIEKILSEPRGQQRRPQQPQQHVPMSDPTSSFTTQTQKRISQLMRERLGADLDSMETACKSDPKDSPCGVYKKLSLRSHSDKVHEMMPFFKDRQNSYEELSDLSDEELTTELRTVADEWFKYVNNQNVRCKGC